MNNKEIIIKQQGEKVEATAPVIISESLNGYTSLLCQVVLQPLG